MRQHRLAHEEGAGEVDRKHLVPVLIGHLQHRLVDRDPGVVDQDVHPPVLLYDRGHGATAILRRADVALVDAAFQTFIFERADERFRRFPVPAVAGRHIGAVLGQAARDRAADSARAAGDERDTAV